MQTLVGRLVLAVAVLIAAVWPVVGSESLRALAEKYSGHIAILPAPGLGGLDSSAVGRTLTQAGLCAHVCVLTTDQTANTNFFNARRFTVALHLGHESYFQNIRTPGDGDVALRNYLAGGGTLFILPAGPFPLFYNEQNKPANGAAIVGVNIGAGGFEQPPPNLKLLLKANTNQAVLHWRTPEFPYPRPEEADQRWRPSRPPGSKDIRYTPLLTLFDDHGQNHGEAAAALEFVQGPLRGGRVLVVWCSLLATGRDRLKIIDQALRWSLAGKPAPATTLLHDNFDGRTSVQGDDAFWQTQAGSWKVDSGNLVGENCVADLFEIKGATVGNTAWRDLVFSVRFKLDSRASDWRDGPWFGLHCRPDGDGYYLTFTDRDCQLHKVVYGYSTSDANPLARAGWKSDNDWHNLRAQFQGNSIRVELDGKELLSARDDSHLFMPSLRSGGIVLAARKGSASKGSTIVRFDDFHVQLLEK